MGQRKGEVQGEELGSTGTQKKTNPDVWLKPTSGSWDVDGGRAEARDILRVQAVMRCHGDGGVQLERMPQFDTLVTWRGGRWRQFRPWRRFGTAWF